MQAPPPRLHHQLPPSPPHSHQILGASPPNQEEAKAPEGRGCPRGPSPGRVPWSPSYSGSLARGRLILLSKPYKILILQSGNLGGKKKKPSNGKMLVMQH